MIVLLSVILPYFTKAQSDYYESFDYGFPGGEYTLYDSTEDVEAAIGERYFGDNCDQNQCGGKWACPPNANCINKCQGYTCQCQPGYYKNDRQCIKTCDENQCTSGLINTFCI